MQAQSADGVLHEFPDDTDPAVVDRVMKDYVTVNPAEPVTADNVVRSAARGIPIIGHLADKANAATYAALAPVFPSDTTVSHAPSWGERYDENLRGQEQKNAAFDSAHPYVSTGAKVVGGAAALTPIAAAAPGAFGLGQGSMIARMATGSGTGAGIGAGDAVSGGEDPARGAAYGAVGGAAAPVVGSLLGSAVRGITNKVALPNFAGSGTSRVERALVDDKMLDPGALESKAAAMGPMATMADFGPNLQRQASAIASQPGAGQNVVNSALIQRAQGAPQRITSALDTAMGGAVNPTAAAEDIVAQRAAAAKPLYDEAYASPLQMTPELQALLQRPAVQTALTKAKTLSANEGVPQGMFEDAPPTLPPGGSTITTAQYKALANPQTGQAVDVRGLDLTKRVLDDIVNVNLRAGKNNAARVVGNLRDRLVAAIDAQAPKYAAARDAYAGPTQIKEALEGGRNVFRSVSPDELGATLDGMSQGERAAFQQGARAAISDTMGSAGNDALAVRSLIKRGWTQQKLKMVLGAEQAQPLIDAVTNESTFARTANKVMEGSDTAAREAAKKEFPSTVSDPSVPHNLNWEGIVTYPFRKAASLVGGSASRARSAKVGEDAANALVATGDARDATIRNVLARVAAQRRNAQVGNGIKLGVGSAIDAHEDTQP